MFVSNLEEVLGDDSQSLGMVTDAFEVGVFIQHSVVGVEEKVERVLIQEVHLKASRNICRSVSTVSQTAGDL